MRVSKSQAMAGAANAAAAADAAAKGPDEGAIAQKMGSTIEGAGAATAASIAAAGAATAASIAAAGIA